MGKVNTSPRRKRGPKHSRPIARASVFVPLPRPRWKFPNWPATGGHRAGPAWI